MVIFFCSSNLMKEKWCNTNWMKIADKALKLFSFFLILRMTFYHNTAKEEIDVKSWCVDYKLIEHSIVLVILNKNTSYFCTPCFYESFYWILTYYVRNRPTSFPFNMTSLYWHFFKNIFILLSGGKLSQSTKKTPQGCFHILKD